MAEIAILEAGGVAGFRSWLLAHHAASASRWLVMEGDLDFVAAAEQALCFGWVDSRPRKLPDGRTALLVSPRRPGSGWSGVNKARVARLRAAGLMAPPGEAAIARAEADGSWTLLDGATALDEPAELRAALSASGGWEAWRGFPPSHRRANLEWLAQAKRPATRAARIAEIATLAARGERANTWPRQRQFSTRMS